MLLGILPDEDARKKGINRELSKEDSGLSVKRGQLGKQSKHPKKSRQDI